MKYREKYQLFSIIFIIQKYIKIDGNRRQSLAVKNAIYDNWRVSYRKTING